MIREKIYLKKNFPLLIISTTIAILGLLALSYVTRFGAGITYDSIFYIIGGKNIFQGNGYIDIWKNPTVNWPPLYSSFIALFSLITGDAIQAANYVNLIFFSLNIFLFGIILFRITNRSYLYTLVGLLIFSSSLDMYLVHRMAWSEPTFYFFMLLSLFYLSKFLESRSSIPLFLSSIFIALTIMARHAGILLIIIGIFVLIFKFKARIVDKIKYSLILIGIPIITLAIWITRNYILTNSTFERKIQIYPIKIIDFKVFLDTISEWFFPFSQYDKLKLIGTILIIAIVTVLFFYHSWHLYIRKNSLQPLPYIFMVFTFFYLLTVLFFRLFMHALDNAAFRFRLVSPLYISSLIIVIWYLSVKLDIKKISSIIKYPFLLILFLFLFVHVRQIGRWVKGIDDGYGYASLKWKTSETLSYVKGLPDSIKVYTNLPSFFCLYTDKNIESVYTRDFSEIDFNKSVIVLIKNIDTRPLKEPEIELGLQKVEKFPDAIIYCSDPLYELVH